MPDLAIIRVGDTYYMSSTTMHMSPGLPIMKSKDLVNWQLVSYAYDTLGDDDALTLQNGKNAYGRGSWASSLRYHDGTFYVSTFSGTTGKTYVYRTKDPEKGPWQATSFRPALHDHSLFFDDDGRVYMIHGSGDIRLTELNADLSGVERHHVAVTLGEQRAEIVEQGEADDLASAQRRGGDSTPELQVAAEDEPVHGGDDDEQRDQPGGEDAGRRQHRGDAHEQDQLGHPVGRVFQRDDDRAVQAGEGGILEGEYPPDNERHDEDDGQGR